MRETLKAAARGISLVLVLPALVSYAIRSLIIGRDRALEGSTQALSLLPGLPGQYLRRAFLARTLAGCANSAVIGYGTLFSKAGASLGDNVYVGPGCNLGLVHLERDVLVGSGVHITSGRETHGTADLTTPIREQPGHPTFVRIGAGAWIGSAAVVMADVGSNSVVGAGAVVTEPIPPSVVAAGVPAKDPPAPRVRILFLTHRLPYAPNRGDRVRAYHLLRHLRRWADVNLVSLVHDADEAAHADDMRELTSSVNVVRVRRLRNLARSFASLPTSRPITHAMLDAPDLATTIDRVVRKHPPSVVLAYCSGMARLALEPTLARVPLVLDMVDVDSAKWAALAARARAPRSWVYSREARLLSAFEHDAACHAFATLVVTEKEAQTMRAIAPDARIDVIANGVDAEQLRPTGSPSTSPVVVFCGVMNYGPNEAGAEWLASDVWPIVRRSRPDARLEIVGSNPTPSVRRLSNPETGIVVTGHVADVRPHLWHAAIAAAPLLTARGVQNKVLEAVAAGLVTVVTSAVFEGLPSQVWPACVRANAAPAFAAAIVELLGQSAADRRQHALQADVGALSWERQLNGLPEILNAAAASRNAAAVSG